MDFLAPKEALLQPIYRFLDNMKIIAPGVMWFVIIILVGYLVSSFVGWFVKKTLYKINIDKRLRKLDLHDSIGSMSIAKMTGMILKWYIFILFMEQAVAFLSLGVISAFLNKIVSWLPALILSIAIIISGLILIDFIVHKLLELKNKYIRIIANVIKGILIIVVIFTAIEQLGIKTDLAQNIFLMVVGAVLITFSLAFGIGLGLGLKDELKPYIRQYKKKLK